MGGGASLGVGGGGGLRVVALAAAVVAAEWANNSAANPEVAVWGLGRGVAGATGMAMTCDAELWLG